MNFFCHTRNIPFWQRITIYKSVIRSRLEYASQVIFYEAHHIREIDKLQLFILRRLLNIDSNVPNECVFLSTGILPFNHRLHQLQLHFFAKVCNATTMASHLH